MQSSGRLARSRLFETHLRELMGPLVLLKDGTALSTLEHLCPEAGCAARRERRLRLVGDRRLAGWSSEPALHRFALLDKLLNLRLFQAVSLKGGCVAKVLVLIQIFVVSRRTLRVGGA